MIIVRQRDSVSSPISHGPKEVGTYQGRVRMLLLEDEVVGKDLDTLA